MTGCFVGCRENLLHFHNLSSWTKNNPKFQVLSQMGLRRLDQRRETTPRYVSRASLILKTPPKMKKIRNSIQQKKKKKKKKKNWSTPCQHIFYGLKEIFAIQSPRFDSLVFPRQFSPSFRTSPALRQFRSIFQLPVPEANAPCNISQNAEW